jgi:hypothetical protein
MLEAAAYQCPHVPVDQGLAMHLQQRLGRVIGQGSHALTATGGQDHGLGGGRWAHAVCVDPIDGQ